MKNAIKMSEWAFKTLTEEEKKMITDAIDTICKNHEEESWARIYYAITTIVTHILSQKHADEMLEELDKRADVTSWAKTVASVVNA